MNIRNVNNKFLRFFDSLISPFLCRAKVSLSNGKELIDISILCVPTA